MKKVQNDFYSTLIRKFSILAEEHHLLDESVEIKGKTLSSREALGNPDRKDFPLLSGKESLMEASFRGGKGQAYTDMSGNFSGAVKDILEMPLNTNHDRAILISTINAVMNSLGLSEKSIHCKDNEPEECARELSRFLLDMRGAVKIALVGFQPSMLEALAKDFSVQVLDLDKSKVGTTHFGVEVRHGILDREDVLSWCDIILCTGSTLSNGTITDYLIEKPVYFYGTTISGTAVLMGFERFCARGVSS